MNRDVFGKSSIVYRCICDRNLHIVSAGDLYKALGYISGDDLKGELADLVCEAGKRDFIKTFLNENEQYGNPSGIFQFVNKEGNKKPLCVSAKMLDYDEADIEFCFRDIQHISNMNYDGGSYCNVIFDNMQAGIAVVEFKSKPEVFFFNKGFVDIFNNAQKHNKKKVSMNSIVNTLSGELFKDKAKDYIYNDKPLDYVQEIVFDNITCYFRIRGIKITCYNTENPVLLMVVNDISDYKKTEVILEEMTDGLNEVINNVPGGIAMFSVTGNDVHLEYANDVLYNIVGVNPSRQQNSMLLESRLSDFVYEQDHKVFEECILECAKTGLDKECVVRFIPINGEITWCHVSLGANKCDGVASVLAVIVDVNNRHEYNEQMRISQEKFRLAFEQTDATMWEYNIKDDVVSIYSDAADLYGDSVQKVKDPIRHFIDQGIVCEESVDEIRKLIDMVKRGVPKGSCLLKTKRNNDEIRWTQLSYVTVFDDAGEPSVAVCISKHMKNLSDKQLRFVQEQTIFEIMSNTDGVVCGIVNLNKNKILDLYGYNQKDKEEAMAMEWNDFIEEDSKYMINMKSKNELKELFKAENLLEAFRSGTESIEKHHQRQYACGRIKWVSYILHLMIEPSSGDVYLFAYIRDIDTVKQAELGLDKKPEYVETSGLYNLETVKSMMEIVKEKSEETAQSSIFVVGIYEYGSRYNSDDRKSISEKTFKFVSGIIKLIFGGCIVGDIGENRLIVAVTGISSNNWLIDTISKTLRTITMSHGLFGDNSMFDYSVGVCTEYNKGADFDKMLKNAKDSLLKARAHIAVHDKEDLMARMDMSEGDVSTEVLKFHTFIKSGLQIGSNEPYDETIRAILQNICQLYQGDRAYVAQLDDEGKIQDNIIEWHDVGISSHIDVIKGGRFGELTYIEQAFRTGEPVIIEDIHSLDDADEYDALSYMDIEGFIIIPFVLENGTRAFICIDNPINLDNDKCALSALGGFISSEMNNHNLAYELDYFKHHNKLTGLLNRTSFDEYADSFNADAITTIGILIADINSLKSINEQFGMEYGNNMLVSVARILEAHFEQANIYRFAGDEYVVICENHSYESFKESVKTMEEELERVYPDLVATGYLWAKEDIDLDRLMGNAEELMMVSKRRYYQNNNKTNRHYNPEQERKLMEHIKNRDFALFLQPKGRTDTEEIAGAEALVRMVDAEKGLIYPDKFIPAFEKNNMIHAIDLFIFEETLRVLEQWKKDGKRLIPISLNFSRATILIDDIVQKMEEIYQKYNVEKKYVQIEITESVGDIDIQTLKNICNGIVDAGYSIALDDFGSKYSSMIMMTGIKFTTIKIDKSMIHDVSINSRSQILMRNIFNACKEIGIYVVAEGVETREQLKMLCEMGCPYAQGYFFNKAIPYEDFGKKYLTLS